MPIYNYKGVHRRLGSRIKGTIQAGTEISAARALYDRDITVFFLEERRPLAGFLSFGEGISTRWQIDFFRRLSIYTGAHLPLPEALALMAKEEKGSGEERAVVEGLAEAVSGGRSLTSALRETGIFPPAAVALVEAGETSGVLERLLPGAVRMLETGYRAKQRLITLLIYPAFLLATLLGAAGLLLFFVLPAFSKLFVQLGVELPLITRFVLAAGEFLLDFGWVILALGILAVAGVTYILEKPYYRREMDRLLLGLPFFGELLCLADSADTAEALSALLEGGLPLPDSLRIAAGVPANTYLVWQLNRASGATRAGRKLAEAMGFDSGFSPVFLSLATAGEETGTLPDSLSRAAEICRYEGDDRRKKLESILEPALLLLAGGLVMALVFALALPLLGAIAVL